MPHRYPAEVRRQVIELARSGTKVAQLVAAFGMSDANGAWAVLACLAHNLLRWTQLLGLPDTTVRAARTLRRWLIGLPGRLTSHARGFTLHLPARWPWRTSFTEALTRIRALPAAA